MYVQKNEHYVAMMTFFVNSWREHRPEVPPVHVVQGRAVRGSLPLRAGQGGRREEAQDPRLPQGLPLRRKELHHLQEDLPERARRREDHQVVNVAAMKPFRGKLILEQTDRSCGYEKYKHECYKTVLEEYNTLVCQCEGDGCNGASTAAASAISVAVGAVLAAVLRN